MVDLYSVLGVSRNAETSEIRTAYKQLAKEHHPDKGGDPEKFKEVSQAHEILCDSTRRKVYDMTGNTSDQPEQSPFSQGHPFGHGQGMPFGNGVPFGMPEMFGNMFGGMFPGANMGGGVKKRREGKAPGKTQEIPLRIADYYHGRQISVKFARQVFCKPCKGSGAASTKKCEQCNGQGQVRQVIQMGPMNMVTDAPCPACRGAGEQGTGQCNGCQGKGLLQEAKNLEIKVEPGMMPGNTVVFSGMCSDNPGFTEAGDVTVILRDSEEENEAARWMREGNKLKTNITINLTEALLGTTKILYGHPGFANGVPVQVSAGVQNLWTGTIPGLGMPIRGTPKFGEAFITVVIVPTDEELVMLRSNTEKVSQIMPPLPPTPSSSEAPRSGTWAAV